MLKLLPTQTTSASPTASATEAPTAAAPAAASPIIIADRGEFVDALRRLRQNAVLVRPRSAPDDERTTCMLDGGYVYTAYEPLLRYGLIAEYNNAEGFAALRYFKLTSSGKRFADKAVRAWRRLPLLQRMVVRLTG